jgi:hypothetical protein
MKPGSKPLLQNATLQPSYEDDRPHDDADGEVASSCSNATISCKVPEQLAVSRASIRHIRALPAKLRETSQRSPFRESGSSERKRRPFPADAPTSSTDDDQDEGSNASNPPMSPRKKRATIAPGLITCVEGSKLAFVGKHRNNSGGPGPTEDRRIQNDKGAAPLL